MKTYFKLSTRMRKIFNYFSILTLLIGFTFGVNTSANANAVNQGTTAVTAYTDADTVTLTATTATTTLAADDEANTFINTDAVDTTWTINGGNDLTVSGAISVLATPDVLTINVTGSGTELTLAEAAVETGGTGSMLITVDDGSIIEVTGADTHVWTLDGASDGVGTLTVTNTGIFSDEIGETAKLATINVATTKTGTFSEEVGATTINSVGTTVFKKAVTATSIILDGTSTVNNTAAIAVAGDFTESTSTDTTLLVVKDSADGAGAAATFSGSITLDAIEVGEDDEKAGIAKFDGNVTAGVTIAGGDATELSQAEFTANLTGATVMTEAGGTATFKTSGSSANTITGAITTTNSKGTLVVANTAGTTFTAGIGTDAAKLLAATVNASSVAEFQGAIAADTLTITGTATLGAATNESEVFAMGASSVLYIDNTITNGQTVISEVATTRPTLTSGAKIYIPENLTNGQTLTLFAEEADNTLADDADTITESNAAIQDNGLFNYVAASSSDTLVVTANAKAEATTASELSVTANAARALKQALASAISDTNVDATAEDALNAGLNGIGFSATEDTTLANQVAPQTDMISGSTFATQAMTGSLQGIMSNRMAALRSGDAYASGMSAGSLSANSGFVQLFATDTEQKNTTVGSGTQFGYDASSAGLAIGFDGISDNGSVVGLSLSMTQTDVDGKGSGKSNNDIDSYTASIYMDKTTDVGYVEGSLTVGLNENNTSRKITSAGLSRTLKADYDSEQISLKIGGGMPNEVGTGFVTPFGSVTVTSISTDAYTETSSTTSDALRLKVAQDDVDSAVGTVGLKYHTDLGDGGIPMISLAINNEFGDNKINSTNTYQGGGSSFQTSTDVEELSATLGLGYSFNSDVASVEFAYEADANDDKYLSHYGSLKIVGKF